MIGLARNVGSSTLAEVGLSDLSLSSPHYLWGLLLLPVLYWLSQPPRPRQHVFTPHLAQWQLAMRALRRRPPRASALRFVLLALAMVCAAFAAAGPVLSPAPGAERLVVLLDASASMGARESEVSAFARARQQLADRLAQLPEHIEVTVLRCGGDLRRRHGASARSLQDLGEPGGRLAVDLVELAAETQSESTAVWTLTDGQGQSKLPAVGALTVVGGAGPNAAILAVRVVDAWPLPTLLLEVDVIAFLPDAVGSDRQAPDASLACTVGLQVTGALTSEQELSRELVSGEVQTMSVTAQRVASGGELALELSLAGDVLAADNRHVLTLPALPAPRIAALSEQDAGPYATVAAQALAEEVGGVVVLASAGIEGARAAGLILVDGGLLPLRQSDGSLAAVRAVTFGTRLAAAVKPQPWLSPTPVDWSRSSVLTRGLDLSELRIERAWRGLLPAGEAFLWSHDGGVRVPLGVLVDAGETASVHLAFRLADSNLPLLPAFPQLLRRAFVRSYGAAATALEAGPGPAVGEQDLRMPAVAANRDLAAFAGREQSLARWFVLLGCLLLMLRAFVR